MSELETNIFRIVNLRELGSTYRTYRIKNLRSDQDNYYQNRQHLIRKLSYSLLSAVEVITRDGVPILVVKQDAPEPPKDMMLVGTQVMLEPLETQVVLNYTARTPENDAICLRFLAFLVQSPLRSHGDLWQCGAGKPFFERSAEVCRNVLGLFRGYSVRPVITPAGEIGLCVDVHSKLIGHRPLSSRMTRAEFQPLKGTHCVYHFGTKWYEIGLSDFSDLNVSQQKFQTPDGQMISVYDYIIKESSKPLPEEIDKLPKDSSVVLYNDNRNSSKSAATALCYPIYGNDERQAQREFPSLAISPFPRRKLIQAFIQRHLTRLRFGDTVLKLDTAPVTAPPQLFRVPDMRFGSGQVLSIRSTQNTTHASLDTLGRKRLSLLKDRNVGFFVSSPLDHFYFIMPQSVHDTYGPEFLKSLTSSVDDLFPQAKEFDPQLVLYQDRNAKTFVQRGDAILLAAKQQCRRGAYAVVMVPETERRRPRQEDKLASFIIQKLRDQSDIVASVIHTTVGNESYRAERNRDGSTFYRLSFQAQGKFNGYLRGVAINKILLLNRKWPYVLASPLHADITIGIDVKDNMAGFVGINKMGDLIVPVHKKSQQKEKLMAPQCSKYVREVINKLVAQRGAPLNHIVIQRDGRLFETEIEGIKHALAMLIKEGIASPDAALTFLEIPKTAAASFRLLDVTTNGDGSLHVGNPQIGNYYVLNPKEGYVCTTGRAFERKGSVHPLHVIKIEGPLSLKDCMEDLFFLSILAWTRPEDCSRHPITMKLNDRRLGEDGTNIDKEVEAAQTLEETEP
jgi:hypothetical protein